MDGRPTDWNAVVVGAWNVAILTPTGIARRLFHLSIGTPVEVQVAIDQVAPPRVVHDEILVVPSNQQLLVAPMSLTSARLARAATIAANAIESLPSTPVSAAGINVRFSFDQIPDSIQTAIESPADNLLADADFSRVSKLVKHTLKWRKGVLNLDIQENADSSAVVLFNFHLPSAEGNDLKEWLSLSDAMVTDARKLLTDTFGVRINDHGEE
jgi:hypothetical protein